MPPITLSTEPTDFDRCLADSDWESPFNAAREDIRGMSDVVLKATVAREIDSLCSITEDGQHWETRTIRRDEVGVLVNDPEQKRRIKLAISELVEEEFLRVSGDKGELITPTGDNELEKYACSVLGPDFLIEAEG